MFGTKKTYRNAMERVGLILVSVLVMEPINFVYKIVFVYLLKI